MIFLLSLQTKADSFYNKESFLQEIFQNVLRTGSNLMANQTLPAWRDLSRSRRIKGQLISKDTFFDLNTLKNEQKCAQNWPCITVHFWKNWQQKRHLLKLTDLLFKVASNLIQTLDEHAFLLLSVLDQPEVIQESTNEIGNDLIRFKVR